MPELDGIRGIAILFVLIWHYLVCILFWKVGILLAFTNLTWSGVDLFFLLSGFLIVGILLDNKKSKNYFKIFYLRRIYRIFPLYYLMFFLFILILFLAPKNFGWLYNNPLPLWTYALFMQNFAMGITNNWGPNWIAVTWSLAIEEQFYLIIPLLIKFFKPTLIIVIFIFFILLAPLTRFLIHDFGNYVFPFARADSILLGGLIAFIVRNNNLFRILKNNKIIFNLVFLIFLIGCGILSMKCYIIGNYFNHSWLAIFYGLFLLFPFINKDSIVNLFLKNKILTWIGLRSYAIYLLHQPVNGCLHAIFNHSSPIINSFYTGSITICALLLTFLIAELSFKFFEKPILRYAHRFKYV